MLGLLVDCSSKYQNQEDSDEESCDWQGAWSDLKNHLAHCAHVFVTCKWHCKFSGNRRLVVEHEQTCHYRIVSCDYCNAILPYFTRKLHQDQKCPNALVGCPNNCSSEPMERRLLPSHEETCPNVLVDCTFPHCSTKNIPRHALVAHIKEAVADHLLATCTQISLLGSTVEDLQTQVKARDLTIDKLKKKVVVLSNLSNLVIFNTPVYGPFELPASFSEDAYFTAAGIKWAIQVSTRINTIRTVQLDFIECAKRSSGAIVSFSLTLSTDPKHMDAVEVENVTVRQSAYYTFSLSGFKTIDPAAVKYTFHIKNFRVNSLIN